jgi:hypothetical protein
MVVTPDWLDSLSSSAALDVYCVVVGNCSNLSSLVQKTSDQLTSAQQADFTTDKEVEDALGHLCCGLEGDTHYYVRDWLSMLRHISVDSDRGFIPLAQLVAVHMRDKFKGDNPGPFELTGRRCALTDYSCGCGPFCDARGMQKDYFFSMIFNDERLDLASPLTGRITGHHWCCLFLSRRPWGIAVATIVDTSRTQ